MQGVRILQNSIVNVPNLANVLILYCQTKASAGLPDKITLLHVSLSLSFPNKPKFMTMEAFVQVVTIVEVLLTMILIMRSMPMTSIKTKIGIPMNGSKRMQ